MKNVTKLLLILILSISCIEISAQSISIINGLNLSKMQMKWEDDEGDVEDYTDELDMLTGFHFGVNFEYSFSDYLSLETGLLFNTKGYKEKGEEEWWDGYEYIQEKWTEKIILHYLDVPVKIKGCYSFADGYRIYSSLGPYVGLGLYGKYKDEWEENGDKETDEEDIEWGDGEDAELKRLDYGLTIGAGAEIKGFLFEINYDYGVANISSYDDDSETWRNRILRFSVGYRFNFSKKSKHAETPIMQDGAYTPVPPSGYAIYSYPELVNLQNQAVKAEDFEKAQKIQNEIVRRESSGIFKDIPVERLEQLLNEAADAKDYNRAARIQNELNNRKK